MQQNLQQNKDIDSLLGLHRTKIPNHNYIPPEIFGLKPVSIKFQQNKEPNCRLKIFHWPFAV